MADVITRFKLETTQYDSKLRDAAKGLQEVVNVANNAGKNFTAFSQKSVEAARALGNTASGASNAKDKVRDLVGSFNDAARAYNKLSEEQQKSDFGKALSESLTQLQARIRETKQELYGLGDTTKKVSGGGLFGGGKLDGMLQVFGGNLMTKGASMLAGLASEMGDMVQQGIELAKQGEGIRIAFERLGRGDILDGLRKATHGTVTDLELMKAAVKFNDFKLPVEELGTMLAFAQQKAKDTGQSVDYMVDSIVTGLGRKSLMILDNLGLSATEVKEKMKETGDMTKAVGQIIREQMSKAGDYVETAADRAAQANVSLQNKMEELGRKFAPVEEASNQLWTSMKIGILDIVGGPLAQLLNGLTEAGRMRNALNNMGGNEQVNKQLGKLRVSNAAGSGYMTRSLYSGQVEQYNRQINAREQQLQDIRAWQSGKRGNDIQSRIDAIRDEFGSLDTTKIKAVQDAFVLMKNEYIKGAQQIMNATKGINTTTPTQGDTGNKTKTTSTTSIEDKIAQMWERAFMKSVSTSGTFVNPNENEGSEVWKAISQEADTAMGPLQKMREELAYLTKSLDEAANPEAYQDIKKVIEGKQRQIADFTGETKPQKTEDKTATELAKISGSMSKVTGGIGNIFNGVQQMGIEIPKEINNVIGVVNGVSTILLGISALLTLINGKQDVQIFTNILPMARGGVVKHAAMGYYVPGTHRSGDVTPIMANAGELVLNESSQGTLAADLLQARGLLESIERFSPMLSMAAQSAVGSQMQGGVETLKLEAYVQGEQLHLVHNRFLKRSGQGELATWK